MKDYSKMSDFEINSAVHNHTNDLGFSLEFLGDDVITWVNGIHVFTTGKVDCANNGLHDYCNSPSDAWPIIESNLICLMADVFCEPQDGGKWIAQPAYGWQHERVRNDNPLRAAMIVYLMMKDEEK